MSHNIRTETIEYVKQLLAEHKNVKNYISAKSNKFFIERKNGKSIVLYIDESYLLSVHGAEEILKENTDVNCIVLASMWLSYSQECKNLMKLRNIGVFKMNELFGALFKDDFWQYKIKEK